MKKSFYFAMMAAAMLFTGCSSSDDDLATGGTPKGLDDDVQRITIAVESTGDGMTTRAGRELLSSEAKQSVENVRLIICDNNHKIVYVNQINNWNGEGSAAYTTGGHGRSKEILLRGNDKLDNGSYTVYAFGYSNESDYTVNGTALGTYMTSTLVKDANYASNLQLATTKVTAEEIFAGSQTLNVTDAEKGFDRNVVLHRQVAGVYVYVKDVPYVEGATHLKLYASDNHKNLVLGNFSPAEGAELGTNGNNQNQHVVNGFTPDKGQDEYGYAIQANGRTEIASITLTDWFTTLKKDANDCLDKNEWKGNSDNYIKGSVFMGQFLIPFRKIQNQNTFELCLVKEGETTPLKTWRILMPGDNTVETQSNYWNPTFGTNGAWSTFLPSADTKEYNVFRNNLYGVGAKTHDTKTITDPSDPDKPTPNEEDPSSLITGQDLTLMVNDNWEVIHKMGIEETE